MAVSLLIQFFHNSPQDNGRQEEGADVGQGLCDLDPQDSQKRSQDQKGRDQEQPLASDGDDCGAYAVADGLGSHISHDDDSLEGEGKELETEGQGSDADNIRISTAEQSDDFPGEQEANYTEYKENDGAHLDAEPAGCLYALVEAGSEAIAAMMAELMNIINRFTMDMAAIAASP